MRRLALSLSLAWSLGTGTGVPQAAPAPAAMGGPARYEAAIRWSRAFIRDTMWVLGTPGASITVMGEGNAFLWLCQRKNDEGPPAQVANHTAWTVLTIEGGSGSESANCVGQRP